MPKRNKNNKNKNKKKERKNLIEIFINEIMHF